MKADLLSLVLEYLGTWKTYLATLLISGVIAYLLAPYAAMPARRWDAVDHPDSRKVRREPMPLLGGLAVVGGFCFPWWVFYLWSNPVSRTMQDYEKLLAALVLGVFAMLGLGIYDDIKGANAPKKFAVQCLVAGGLYWAGYRIGSLTLPILGPVELGWMSLPVSLLWMVGITNAMNLLDGIDGLATGVTACIALALAFLNMLGGHVMVALLSLCLAGACLGFLPYNFSPARMFLGDSGSLTIGLILSCIGILSLFKAATATFLAVPLLIFGLPFFDTASVMVTRSLRGHSMFRADKSHVHHRLLARGLTHKGAACLLYGVTVLCAGAGVVLNLRNLPVEIFTVASLVCVFAVWCWWGWKERVRREALPEPPGPPAGGPGSPGSPVSS
jgi:UDP-GlcNAc:undecaprenyl-phosphate GlcNAc-1-phosphate transferase